MFNEYFSTVITWEQLKVDPILALFFAPPTPKKLYVSLPQFSDEDDESQLMQNLNLNNNNNNNNTRSPQKETNINIDVSALNAKHSQISIPHPQQRSESAKQLVTRPQSPNSGLEFEYELGEQERNKEKQLRQKFTHARKKANTLSITLDKSNAFKQHYLQLQQMQESIGIKKTNMNE